MSYAGAASGAGQAAGGSTGVKISITYGQQQSESRTHTVGNTAAKSQVNAGGKVNIIATGAVKHQILMLLDLIYGENKEQL